ncbi:MAG: BTAD domain-containing putative transcriptional regulator, partial [Acidimicrobiia bacterium]
MEASQTHRELIFRLLGPFEVMASGSPLRLGVRQRAVLAALVLRRNRVVPLVDLIEGIWDDKPPASAAITLQSVISRLRGALASGGLGNLRLLGRSQGYVLEVDERSTDVFAFESLRDQSRESIASGEFAQARESLVEALSLWRGAALADLAGWRFLQPEARRLDEARLVAVEALAETELALGQWAEALVRLEPLVESHPLRERAWGQLMVALYRTGRQAEALRAYQRLRRILGEQLGIEPSPAVRELERQFLLQAPDLKGFPVGQVGPPARGGGRRRGGRGILALLVAALDSGRLSTSSSSPSTAGRSAGEAIAEQVDAHGGSVVRHSGREAYPESIWATFPTARAAVSTAVATQRALRGHPGADSPRVGIHVGEVDFGDPDPVNPDQPTQPDQPDEAFAVARRLCEESERGQILVSDVVRSLAGIGTLIYGARPVQVRTLSGPVNALLVSWEPERLSMPGPLAVQLGAGSVPFVGRDEERGRLGNAWARAGDGHRQMVLIGGEPGIGKTRLCAELTRSVFEGGGTVLYGGCDEGALVPYQPLVHVVRQLVGSSAGTTSGGALGELAARERLELTRLVPELAETPGPSLPPADPETERFRLFEAVASLLVAASRPRPLLIVLDDLHWAARPGLLMLHHVAQALEASPVLLLGTYRDVELTRSHPLTDLLAALRRERLYERIQLRGLSSGEVNELLEAWAGRHLGSSGRSFAEALWRETEGNPFFIGEMIQHLSETGRLSVEESGEALDSRTLTGGAAEDIALDIPEGVRHLIGRRVSRLSVAANSVLANAAILGREFEFHILSEMVEMTAEELLAAVDEALEARLLAEVPERAEPTYAFTHTLVREVLLDELGRVRRESLHARAAQSIEAVSGLGDARAATLASHYRAAGRSAPADRAIEAAVRAGEVEMRSLAWEGAFRHWQSALSLMETSGTPPGERAELLGRLSDLVFASGAAFAGDGPHEGARVYSERALVLRQDEGEATRVAEARIRLGRDLAGFGEAMDVPAALGYLDLARQALELTSGGRALGYAWAGIAAASVWAQQPVLGLAAAEAALALAAETADPTLAAQSAQLRGWHLAVRGSVEEGLRLLGGSGATERPDAAGALDGRLVGFDPAWARGCWSLMLLDPVDAVARFDRELGRPRTAEVPSRGRLLQGQLAWAQVLCGNPEQARSTLARVTDPQVGFVGGPPLALWKG